MANQKITVVFQDCPLCGDRGKKIQKIVVSKGIRLRKVSFASDEGRELISKAVFEAGIKTMPFYYDGKRFSTSLSDILARKRKKTTRKKKTEKEDGNIL